MQVQYVGIWLFLGVGTKLCHRTKDTSAAEVQLEDSQNVWGVLQNFRTDRCKES
jgi:hypothetical protein